MASFWGTEKWCTILKMAWKSGPNGANHFQIYCEIAKLVFFASVFDWFCKIGSGDHIHASKSKNSVSFFAQGSILPTEIVFSDSM